MPTMTAIRRKKLDVVAVTLPMDEKYSRISPIVQCAKWNIMGVFYLRKKAHGFRKKAAQKRKHHSTIYTEVSDAALNCEYSIAGKS
jgi:hypothetical protein